MMYRYKHGTPLRCVLPEHGTPLHCVLPEHGTPLHCVLPEHGTPLHCVLPEHGTPLRCVLPEHGTPLRCVLPEAAPGSPIVRWLLSGVALTAVLLCGACAGHKARPDKPPVESADSGDELTESPALPESAAAAPATPPPPPRGDAEPAPAQTATATTSPTAEPPAKGTPVRYAGPTGSIPRKDLLSFLDTKPAAFLRSVDPEAHLEGGRFRGWRIASFFPGDPRFTGIDLLAGDVVVRVNGRPLEQPDQFIKVWDDLRAAHELRVELLRNGRPHIARWTIVD